MLTRTFFLAKIRQAPIIALPLCHFNCKGRASFLALVDDPSGNIRWASACALSYAVTMSSCRGGTLAKTVVTYLYKCTMMPETHLKFR